MKYLWPKWVYRAKKIQRSFLNGASQYAHGDLLIRNLIYIVALSADPLLTGLASTATRIT
jgi:hypothetical protein